MYGGDDNGDLMAIVRSCSRMIKGKEIAAPSLSASDPFMYLPPPPPPPSFPMGTEESMPTIFSDLLPTNQATFGGLEDICMPFLHHTQPQPPQPQPQPQQHVGLSQTLLAAVGTIGPTSSASSAAASATAAVACGSLSGPLGKLSLSKQTRKPRPPATSCKKLRAEKKKVVKLSEDIRVPNDNWAWRKYGQKPIKGSPYPRGYYRCSTCMSCPARKMVDKCQRDPEMFAITYTGEHNHPLPTHRNRTAGSTRNKYSASSGSGKKLKGLEVMSFGLSPTTPLSTLSLTEEKDDEEAMLEIDDMDIVGDDEVVLLGDTPLKTPAVARYSLSSSDADDPFLSQMWNERNVYYGDIDGGATVVEDHGAAN